jgi:spermidine synthase
MQLPAMTTTPSAPPPDPAGGPELAVADGLAVPPPGGLALAARIRLRIAIFIAGAAVMVLQIVGTRIIGPQFGAGMTVWTVLITITLVALALGAFLGGRIADRHPSPTAFAVVLLVAAATVGLVVPLRGPVLGWAWALGIRGGALAASSILFLPPLLLLGMISPFAVRLEATGSGSAGRSAGRLYAISTAGSVAGAIAAGFFLVPLFRIPTLLLLLAATLAVAAVVAAAPTWQRRLAVAGAGIVLAAALPAWPRPMPPQLLAVRSHEGSDLRVVEHDGRRHLLMDQVVQSVVDAAGRPADKYAYHVAARVALARPQARRAAVIGLGGGGLVTLLEEQGITVDGVDVAPEVINLAREFFGLAIPPERLHPEDGRIFLRRHPATFDVVILDAFSGDRVAGALVSREGLAVAHDALLPGGLLILNTWGVDEQTGSPTATGAAIRGTLAAVFPEVIEVPAAGNCLFLASDRPIGPARTDVELRTFDGARRFTWQLAPPVAWPEATVLTDDCNMVDVLDIARNDARRVARREAMPLPVREALDWE